MMTGQPLDSLGTLLPADAICNITFEEIGKGVQYSACPQCKHTFIYAVLADWVSRNATCPCCRLDLRSIDLYVSKKI